MKGRLRKGNLKKENWKKGFALLLAGVITLGGLSGCGGNPNGATTGTNGQASNGTSQTEQTKTDLAANNNENTNDSETGNYANTSSDTQVISVRTTSFGNNYDVQDMGWRWMMGDCYEGLYRNVADAEGEHFILAGAEGVEVSEDETVYTFHLRQNAKWSDGQPVTAYDYEYGWKRLVNPAYGYSYASFIYNVVGAQEYNEGTGTAEEVKAVALDEFTFQVTLKVPDPTFEVKLVATPLYPTRQDIAEAAGEQWGKDWTLCVYNGPFCMSELLEDNKMVWTKNPYYWDADNTHLDAVNWFIVSEDSTAATMFDNGELDQFQPSGDYAIKYRKEAEKGTVQLLVSDYPGTVYLRFNSFGKDPSGLMGNAKIRKAIAYSVDREEMVDAVYGRYKPAYSYIPPAISFQGSSYRAQTEEVTKAEYDTYVKDTDAIRALFQEGLDELGITTPISEITISYLSSGNSNENNAEREYLQQSIQSKIGCKVEFHLVGDNQLFRAERDAGNFDIYSSGWYADYNDPLDFLYTFYTDAYGTSFAGYSNAEYDALIDSLTGETDLAKRKEIYEKLEYILLMEDCAIVPIYYSTKEVLLQNWVKDYRTSSFGASAEFYITYIEGRNR